MIFKKGCCTIKWKKLRCIQWLRCCCIRAKDSHDDIINWKHFPRHWPFVRWIHRPPVNSPHTGQWREALMFSLKKKHVYADNRDAGDFRCHCTHHDVTVMNILGTHIIQYLSCSEKIISNYWFDPWTWLGHYNRTQVTMIYLMLAFPRQTLRYNLATRKQMQFTKSAVMILNKCSISYCYAEFQWHLLRNCKVIMDRRRFSSWLWHRTGDNPIYIQVTADFADATMVNKASICQMIFNF